LAWKNRGALYELGTYTFNVKTFVSEIEEFDEDGPSPWLNAEDTHKIHTKPIATDKTHKRFTFQNFTDIGEVYPITIDSVYLNVTVLGSASGAFVKVYFRYSAGTWIYLGDAHATSWYNKKTTRFNVTSILNTVAKIESAELYVVAPEELRDLWIAVDHAYLTVYGSPFAPIQADQRVGDYFVINMGKKYDDITAILYECRENKEMYARNYKIQYTSLSNCCCGDDPPLESDWHDFTPAVNVVNNYARDILHSWEPEDDVQCIRIQITGSANVAWEISQAYIWQSDTHKYRLLDEGD